MVKDLKEQYYRKDWMNDIQWECAQFIAELYGGFNHVFGKWRSLRDGVQINEYGLNRFATYDYDYMTRAVVMAHDACIRFSIEPSKANYLKLTATKRARSGDTHEIHPALEQAIEKIRSKYNA